MCYTLSIDRADRPDWPHGRAVGGAMGLAGAIVELVASVLENRAERMVIGTVGGLAALVIRHSDYLNSALRIISALSSIHPDERRRELRVSLERFQLS